MLRCLPSIRFAVHSSAGRFALASSKCRDRLDVLRGHQRSSSTAVAKRQQDETRYTPSYNSSLTSTSDYLDFILSDREGEPLVRASDEKSKKTGPRKATRKPRVQSKSKDAQPQPKPRRSAQVHVKPASNPFHRKERAHLSNRSRRPALTAVEQAHVDARWKAWVRGRHERPRAVSLRSALRTSAVFSSAWSVKYNKIDRRYDSTLQDTYLEEAQTPDFQPPTLEWVESLLGQMDGRDDTLDVNAFARTYDKLGREVWSEVALWLMFKNIERLPDFLLATHAPLYPPINWVEDCLQHLSRHYNQLAEDRRDDNFRRLVTVFLTIVHRDTNEQLRLNSGFLRHLLPYCTNEQVNESYGLIKSHKVLASPYTLHHFSDWFATHGHIEQALDALLEARAVGADVQGLAFRKNCAALLRQSIHHPGGLRVCLRMIENLVSIGVNLNTRLCNIIMLNAVESGDLETMHSVHRSALEQGLQDDMYTCAIMLKACKQNIDDAENLREVIQVAIQNGNVRHNVVLATEILHCLALHHTKHNPETAYRTLSEAYLQLFDAKPLERLGLRMPDTAEIQDSGASPMPPSNHAICFVVASFLEHTASPQDAQRLYSTWRSLVEAGDPALASLASTPYFANLFLQKFCRARSSLLQAAGVVKDMQKALPESAGVKQCEPDVYTWSIFLDGFARNGQTKLAEQVLNYMRSKGVEPSPVTWNSLLGGYAAAQDVDGTLDALRRLESSGATYDEWTAGGLRRLHNQQRLRAELEKQRYEQSMDFTRDLKRDFEAKLATEEEGDEGYTSDMEALYEEPDEHQQQGV